MPRCSIIAAAVRRAAAVRAAAYRRLAAAALCAATHAVPTRRARSCRLARRDKTVVHVPPSPSG
eukprot:2355582-Prymnesium_polylepis.1